MGPADCEVPPLRHERRLARFVGTSLKVEKESSSTSLFS